MKIILYLLLALATASCGQPLEDSIPANLENIAAKWKVHEIIIADHHADVVKPTECDNSMVFEFSPDGQISAYSSKEQCAEHKFNAKWLVDKDSVYISYLELANKTYTGKHEIVQLTATTLILKITDSGDFITLKKEDND